MNDRLKKYIEIVEVPNEGAKTKHWVVKNKAGDRLGRIRWYGGWRKYVYYNNFVGYSDWDFLRMIADFCEDKTKEHYGH